MSIKTKELVNTWGGWLGEESWDYFSTITYRYDISARRNENIMLGIEERLKNKTPSHKLFWIMEYTSNNYQTHNHLLIKGDGARDEIDLYLKEKGMGFTLGFDLDMNGLYKILLRILMSFYC